MAAAWPTHALLFTSLSATRGNETQTTWKPARSRTRATAWQTRAAMQHAIMQAAMQHAIVQHARQGMCACARARQGMSQLAAPTFLVGLVDNRSQTHKTCPARPPSFALLPCYSTKFDLPKPSSSRAQAAAGRQPKLLYLDANPYLGDSTRLSLIISGPTTDNKAAVTSK